MNRFIMANSQQCLGCHACEIACVMAHNDEQHVLSQHHFHPRITVIKHQQQRSAVTCHHCEDAPCARSCPNGAISHVDDSIQVNQQKCIGCKSCVVACPFGTMQIVLTPVAAGKVKATAHKCDLCAGRENGPACVENCPADALQLVTDVALSGMAKSRRLRTARQEHQPWHASTAAQEMPVMSKVEQMQQRPRVASRINWRLKRAKPVLMKFICHFAPTRHNGKPRAALSAASTAFVNGSARCITIYRSGLNW